MKRYNHIRLLIFFLSFILSAASSANAAYQIGYMYIQNRIYQDGRHFNKLYFEMKTDSGAYISNTNVVTAVRLINPYQEEADLETLVFQPNYELILGQYDCNNSGIIYSSPVIANDYAAVIGEPLIPGTYRLEVTADDSQTYTKDYLFEQAVDLPFISSNTFEIRSDASGNVFWTWDIPDSLSTEIMSQDISVASRAFINIYDDDQNTAYFHVRIPSHMRNLYLSNEKVEELMSRGNKFYLGVDVRTNNDNNRSYGNTLRVSDLRKTVSKKKVVVIPLVE